MQTIIKIIIAIVVGIIVGFVLKIGLQKQELVDCYKYQDYEKTYSDFQLQDEQIDRCLALGVEIIPFRNDEQKYNQY